MKVICIILILAMVLCGCSDAGGDAAVPTHTTGETWQETMGVPGQVDMSKVFQSEICYVNQWGGCVYTSADNADTLDRETISNPPIHVIRSLEELEQFITECGNDFSRDQTYNDVPSFDSLIQGKDAGYFAKSDLLLVAIPAGSGSFRYGVDRIEKMDGKLTVHAVCTHFPDAATLDLAGWFLLVTVPKAVTQGCENFDATLEYPQ